ncbi:T9SS type A sorting domain-containing protein [Flavobacterium sp. N1718]|nr:T9SS type A sorting domain-containing protein [Flavobacterium sp. N1718]
MEATTGGATGTAGVPAPGCGSYLGGDVWYSVVVPSTGNLTVETGPAQGITTFDSAIALYSGDCGSMTLISCDDDGAATDAFSKLTVSNRTPGEVIYIRVWEYSNDNVAPFSLSAYDASLTAPGFDADSFLAYPNPVTTVLNLSYTKNISNVAVFNLLGQQVLAKAVSATATQMDMTPLAAGTYLVKVTVDGAVKTLKVVKQ